MTQVCIDGCIPTVLFVEHLGNQSAKYYSTIKKTF